MKKEIITKKIDKISFGVVSPSLMKKMGVVNVVTPEIYDADGYPVKKGLMDPNMGVIDPGLRCKTCGGRMKTCPGHFGYIQLSKPVIHVLYAKNIYNIIRSSCEKCGRITASQDKIEKWKEEFEKLRATHNLKKIRNLMSRVVKKLKRVKKCPYCEAKLEKIKFVKPTTIKVGKKRIWPIRIKEWLEKIPDKDISALGYNPAVFRPEWLVITTLPVPPITMRPSITLESGERSEDDLTHKLSDVVRVNQRLLENINAGAPEIIVEDLWDLLQYHVTTFFNNKLSQIPSAKHKTRRPLKTLSQRLSGKEGRFRYNLAGKRVNFCSRSVISPDPNIDLNEVGIPLRVAKELTVPTSATDWNVKWLKKLIKNQGGYPCAPYVITEENKRRRVTEETMKQILEQVKPGWIVERQVINGDIVVFNRQPSLHRLSMMGHKVKVLGGSTLRINPSVCVSYNADFDGDEMNLHLPQTEESRAEARKIMTVDNQIITPRYGSTIIGLILDCLMGNYYLTKNTLLTKSQVSDLVLSFDYDSKLPNPKKKKGGKSFWDGKQIFSLLLPNDLNFENEGQVFKKGKIKDGKFIIKKGKIVQGIVDKKQIGKEGGSLIHKIHQQYGNKRAVEFINKMGKLGLAVSKTIGDTISLSDLDIPKAQKHRITNILKKSYTEADEVIKEFEKGKTLPMPGKTKHETFEANILKALNDARNKMSDTISKVVKENTTLVQSAHAGAGDKVLNIALMSGFVGQQALRGKRVSLGYTKRTLPHFKKNDLGPKSHGFIAHGYVDGMDPIELFFNAIVGRDSLMDTAMRTPKSGYMQRRLVNALQDLKVNYDGTVRDSGRGIVQFKFGGDSIDVSRSDGGKLDVKI